MKIGIGSYAFRYAIGHPELSAGGKMTLRGLLDFCHSHNLKALQICENISLEELPVRELEEARAVARDFNITIELGTTGYQTNNLRKYIRLCSFFSAKILRTVLQVDKSRTGLNDLKTSINNLLDELENHEVTLAVENHFDLNPAELSQLIGLINHPAVKICLDPLNSLTQLWGINETIEILGPYTVSAHLKDVKVRRSGAGFSIEGCPLGQGLADIPGYISRISHFNKDCNLFIEQWQNQEESLPLTLQTEKEWVKKGLTYLKKCTNIKV